MEYVCDGEADCSNNEDETNGTSSTTEITGGSFIKSFGNGNCLMVNQILINITNMNTNNVSCNFSVQKFKKFRGKFIADVNTLVPGGNDFDTN